MAKKQIAEIDDLKIRLALATQKISKLRDELQDLHIQQDKQNHNETKENLIDTRLNELRITLVLAYIASGEAPGAVVARADTTIAQLVNTPTSDISGATMRPISLCVNGELKIARILMTEPV